MPQQTELEELLTLSEVEHGLKIKRSTLRKWIFERRIPIVRVGRRSIRIPASWVREQIANGYRPAVNLD